MVCSRATSRTYIYIYIAWAKPYCSQAAQLLAVISITEFCFSARWVRIVSFGPRLLQQLCVMLNFTAQQFARYTILETCWSLSFPKMTLPFPVLPVKLISVGQHWAFEKGWYFTPFWYCILIQGFSQDLHVSSGCDFYFISKHSDVGTKPYYKHRYTLADLVMERRAKTCFATHQLHFCVVSNFYVNILAFSLLQN